MTDREHESLMRLTKESDYAGRLRGWIGHPACPAQAVQDDLRAGADEIERLQAKIDALMLEHCPDEMTPEQRTEWAKHQRPSAEPSGCPEHGMEHFFEGMCIKCGVVPAAKSNSGLYRHAWELLPGGSYRCLRCKTLCLEPHDANLCSLPPARTNEQS